MADYTPPLLRIPWELRDKIYQHILLDPAAPIFEGINKHVKYTHYLGLMYANKMIYEEVKATLEDIKPLVIISCNIEHLGELMTDHAIPYISNHHAGQVKCHSVRLHVKFPMGKEGAKVLKAYIVLSAHLKDVSLLLRSLSLTLPHAPGQPVMTNGTEFPTMQISIKLESAGEIPMPRPKQIRILEQMAWLNHIGKITISGCIDEKVKAILPGHDERLPSRAQDISQVLNRMNKFRMSRYADGVDAIEIAAWKNKLATRACRAKDFQLALDRYVAAMTFIEKSEQQNVYMLQVEGGIREKLDNWTFRAELGLTQCCIGLNNWEEASHHIKIITEDLPERSYISKEMVACARGLERRIRKKLGPDYEDAKMTEETAAEEAMASLSLGDDGRPMQVAERREWQEGNELIPARCTS